MATAVTTMYSNPLYDAETKHATSTTLTQQQEEVMENEQFLNTLFCRALYDYEAQSESSLSFRKGEVIEVLTQEPSGWWDGLLGDDRGWFPSNYVQVISDEEAEQIYLAQSSGTESSMLQTLADSSMVDRSHGMMRGMGPEADEWLENETLSPRYGIDLGNGSVNTSQTDDYWMPEVGPNGQILFYVNTQTGQRSREAPELDDEISDTDLVGLTSQSSSRSGTSTGLIFGLNGSSEDDNAMQDTAGFGIPRRTGTTPEPWVRKLRDDGRSFYFYNKITGKVSLTRPDASPRTSSHVSSSPPQQRPTDGSQRFSVYSDDSDIHPHEPLSRRSTTNGHPTKLSSELKNRLTAKDRVALDSTTAERLAQALQKHISTPHQDRATEIDELTSATNSAIDAVINNIQMNGMVRRAEEDRKMNDLIYNVVLMVRNLLYTLAAPTLQIPTNLLDSEVKNTPPPQSPLKPVQRKVTATLSRLVLSARALYYDSGVVLADTLSRIEVDAEGLKNDVAAFVLQVQRLENSSESPRRKYPKRVHGVFSTRNIGLGLVGAGEAGRWKGFGWVRLDDDQVSSQRVLGPEVISELKQYSTDLNERFQDLLPALQAPGLKSVEQVRLYGKVLVSQIASLLTCISDIHVARHVDIDDIQQDGSSASSPYSRTVETARQLVRTLEAVVQAVYNDTAVFFFTLQSVRSSNLLQYRKERRYAWDHLDALSSSLVANISDLLDTLDALLSLGHEQAEMSSGDYNGSIEWRMSRVSIRPAYMPDDTPDTVVSMEMAFVHPPAKSSKMPESYPSYTRPHTNSDASHTLHSTSFEYSATNTLVPEEEKEPHDGRDPDFVGTAVKSPPRAVGSRKLEKLLGAEYASKVAADHKPWYLRPNYSPEDILIEADNTVKGGTLPSLVERLTAHDQVDPTFNQAFLMTFKSFMTVNELFNLLVARFRLEPPAGLKPEELKDWEKQKKHLIQIRVINTFVTMLKDDDILEKEDFHIFERMKAFVSSDEVSQFGAAKQVLVYIDRAIRNDNNALKAMPLSTPPPPIYPKTTKKLKLVDIEPLELARQLTIMESNLYQKIKPMECLQRAREQKTDNMDNIATVIQMSNRIADWVADCVLSKEDSRKRASTVKYLISVADRCRTLNNFSSMIAITSGLNTPPIRRLKRTWEQVNQRSMVQFTACEMTIDSNKNFTKYRQLMASVTPPCVPFIGVFLSTLQFIQDGNPDMLPGGLVNFRKRQKASEVINDIKRWQAQPFNLQPIPSVQAFIDESLNQFTDSKASSEQFWTLSLEREPREREDEKMARLLQESGFL